MSKSLRPRITVPVIERKPGSLGNLKRVTPKTESSKCVVCGGDVVETVKNIEEEKGRHFSTTTESYNCSRCGLCYAFHPPSTVRRKI